MKNHEKHETNNGKDQGVVTLWIDSYNDIFSDFDPRPFSERTISDDFITQVKRVSKEKSERVAVLKLLVPEGTQLEDQERIIKKRIQSYFHNICSQLKTELKRIKVKGYLFTCFGMTSMIVASYISFLNMPGFSFKLIFTLLEPGGWFLLWTGLDLIISASGNRKTEFQFYERMENIHVEFSSYK